MAAGTVRRMSTALERAALVTTNFEWIDADGKPLPVSVDGVRADASGKFLKNLAGIFIGKTSYFGCAMAFHRDLVPLILPIRLTSNPMICGSQWLQT